MEQIVNSIQNMHLSRCEILFLIDVLEKKLSHESEHDICIYNLQNDKSFVDFLLHFWDYDHSPYITEKKAYNQSIGKKYCHGHMLNIKRYYRIFFLSASLENISRQLFKEFIFSLDRIRNKPLSAATKNKIISAGIIALKWAYDNGFITQNIVSGLKQFSVHTKKRGILTTAEVAQLFAMPWENEFIKTANFVAMSTGLRAGEIIALKWKHIEKDKIHVCATFSLFDGIKVPKNGEYRIAILTDEALKTLMQLKKISMNTNDDDFIFFNYNTQCLFSVHDLRKGLYSALLDVGVSRNEQIARNVVFHSWRHFYSTLLCDQITPRKIRITTGHKSAAVFEEYANHCRQSDILQVRDAAGKAFDGISYL